MKLNDLVRHIDHTGASDAEITAITYDLSLIHISEPTRP